MLSVLVVGFCIIALGAYDEDSIESNITFACFCIFSGLIVVTPILYTILAIRNHWSKYLDWFFNQLWYPTLVLALLLFLEWYNSWMLYKSAILEEIAPYISLFVIPVYILIYLVILINNIVKYVKRKRAHAKES